MHYLGMSALEMPGHIAWSWDLVAASVLIGMMFGAASLWIAIHRSGTSGMLTAGVLLTLAIVSHHFTAMGAVEIVPDPSRVVNALSLSPAWMAIGIASAAVAVLAMSLAGAFVDKRTAERIAHLAHHDPLTDLPNRAAFTAEFASVLERSGAGDRICRPVHRPGPVQGDQRPLRARRGRSMLRQVAGRLWRPSKASTSLGSAATSSRSRAGSERQTAADLVAGSSVGDVAKSRNRRPAHPRRVSIGVAVFRMTARCGEAAPQRRRGALPREGGRPRREAIFDRRNGRALREGAAIRPAGAERSELEIIISRRRRSAARSSASRRWCAGTIRRAAFRPADLHPVAEESGLIMQIGEWVLREACREAASWPRQLQSRSIFRRCSSSTATCPTRPRSAGNRPGPDALELEITEGVLMPITPAPSRSCALKALGVRIAMDDFGTGYSSLSYLQSFPFDKIKIDRAFIPNLKATPNRPRSCAP